jgi:hypothetical protein
LARFAAHFPQPGAAKLRDSPAGQRGPADPLLPQLGLPITVTFEKPPTAPRMRLAPGQSVIYSVPSIFPFPPADARLRAVDRARLDRAHRYTPLILAEDNQARSYGDAGCYIEFGSGPARNGKVLYLWSALLGGPEGDLLMADAVQWIVSFDTAESAW